MNLTPHFTLAEFTHSQTAARRGIDNRVPLELMPNLVRTAELLEAVRAALGVPIVISSGYRCPELNRFVGGARRSAHVMGLAADFTAPRYGTPLQVATAVRRMPMPFDQLILEYGSWVHLGLALDGARVRRQVLTAHTGGVVSGLVAEPVAA